MDTRVAIIAIIVAANDDNSPAIQQLNEVLHNYANHIIGRMGVPYPAKGVNIISVALDANQDTINELSGRLGSLDGISAKTVYAPQ